MLYNNRYSLLKLFTNLVIAHQSPENIRISSTGEETELQLRGEVRNSNIEAPSSLELNRATILACVVFICCGFIVGFVAFIMAGMNGG